MAKTCKYYKLVRQVSYDSGQTWTNLTETQKGDLYQTDSPDCVEYNEMYRWVNLDPSTDYYCEGTTKYYKQQKQVSYDSGTTWQNVTPSEYQKGGSAQTLSTDCGYDPSSDGFEVLRYEISYEYSATYNGQSASTPIFVFFIKSVENGSFSDWQIRYGISYGGCLETKNKQDEYFEVGSDCFVFNSFERLIILTNSAGRTINITVRLQPSVYYPEVPTLAEVVSITYS